MALTYAAVQKYSDQYHGATKMAVSHTNWGVLATAAATTANASVSGDKKHIIFTPGTNAPIRNVLLFPDPSVVADDIKVI